VHADLVKAMRVRIPHESLNIVNNRDMPEICLQHLLATMLIDGRMDFHSAHDRVRMNDPAVLAVRQKISLSGDDALSRAMPSREGIVEVDLADGRTLQEHTRAVRGTPNNPMTRSEVQDKALGLLTTVLGPTQSIALCEAIWTLETATDARPFCQLLAKTH
jgi:2-methylcitrate dehydratase PrpD